MATQLVILTGPSGAGKSTIGHVFEEKDYRIIENIPPEVFPSLLSLIKSKKDQYPRVLIQASLADAVALNKLAKADPSFKTIFVVLDCSRNELMSRFRLTRHVHPLEAKGLTLEQCIAHDEKLIAKIRPEADLYLDTTNLTSTDLRKKAFTVIDNGRTGKLSLIIASFGYKYGVPQDAEIVFDTRIVPNPFWIKGMQDKTGLDPEVIKFLDEQKECPELFAHMCDFLDYYLAHLEKEGRNYVFVYVGCSGGQHRSIYFAEKLYKHYKAKYSCAVHHRELSRYRKES